MDKVRACYPNGVVRINKKGPGGKVYHKELKQGGGSQQGKQGIQNPTVTLLSKCLKNFKSVINHLSHGSTDPSVRTNQVLAKVKSRKRYADTFQR